MTNNTQLKRSVVPLLKNPAINDGLLHGECKHSEYELYKQLLVSWLLLTPDRVYHPKSQDMELIYRLNAPHSQALRCPAGEEQLSSAALGRGSSHSKTWPLPVASRHLGERTIRPSLHGPGWVAEGN